MGFCPRWILGICLYVLILPLAGAQESPPHATDFSSGKIESIVGKLHSEVDPLLRVQYAKELSHASFKASEDQLNSLNPRIIDEISSFLKDNNDLVRFHAAAALGDIGRPATRALPALEEALRDITSVPPGTIGPSLTSESAIRSAIFRISGKSTR
jgi:HEAT repeat protein